MKENKYIEEEEEEENIGLVLAFNNPTMDAETFEKVLLEIAKILELQTAEMARKLGLA